MLDKDYLLEHITEEQMLELLNKFGAQPYGAIRDNEIWFSTICHGGKSHKLCYFRDSKSFYCYTNCGQMSVFNLIMKIKGCAFVESLEVIANAMGINKRYGFDTRIATMSRELIKIEQYVQLRKRKPHPIEHLKKIDSHILSFFESDVFYEGWISEGISIKTMQKFGIRWYEGEKHIIIPHSNINGELVGIRRRSLQFKDAKNKYMPETIEGITYTHSLNMNLFGIDKHMQGIIKTKKVVITESEKSVMLAHEYYGEDAFVVATCGFNISNWHRDLLLSLGVEEVMLAFDKDIEPIDFLDLNEEDAEYKAYIRFVKRLFSLAHKFTAYCKTYILWDDMGLLVKKDSPFDRGKETLEKIMKSKIEINTNREEEE